MTTVTFPLLDRKPITYESAEQYEHNIIRRISWFPATRELYNHLWSTRQRRAIASLTALHVGLDPERQHARCIVQKPETWIHGSFNICIPVHVLDRAGDLTRKVLIRCPMAHKLAEDHYPGTVNEKLGTEVATYIWMQQHCQQVPIPNLLGFGFTDGRHVCFYRFSPPFLLCLPALYSPLISVHPSVPAADIHPLDEGFVAEDLHIPSPPCPLTIHSSSIRSQTQDWLHSSRLYRTDFWSDAVYDLQDAAS